jgi:2-polyprenyl-6-methoxyphenol hydroxylase-like FAD-dependent oxidoreductase
VRGESYRATYRPRRSIPVATGLHAIGDTVCTTNPTLGRGLALALSGAADLVDTIGEHPADPAAQALALDRLADAHVVPFYQDQATIDAARLSSGHCGKSTG